MELKAGARVVYPGQGICVVEERESLEIGGLITEFVCLRRSYDSASVRVPVARVGLVGIRPVASPEEATQALKQICDTPAEPDMNWKTRQRRHQQTLAAGQLEGLAGMVRELFMVAQVRPLPSRERTGYDQVRRLLVEELGEVLDLPAVSVENQIDLALAPPAGEFLALASGERRAAKSVPKKTKAKGAAAAKKGSVATGASKEKSRAPASAAKKASAKSSKKKAGAPSPSKAVKSPKAAPPAKAKAKPSMKPKTSPAAKKTKGGGNAR